MRPSASSRETGRCRPPETAALAAVPLIWPWVAGPALLVVIAACWLLWRSRQRLALLSEGEVERQRMSSLFHHGPDPMLMVSSDGRIRSANRAFRVRHPGIAAQVEGRPIAYLFSGSSRRPVLGSVRGALNGRAQKSEARIVVGESPMDVELAIVPTRSGERVDGVCVYVRDITDRKNLEHELQSRALHDYLTGLPNRALFQDRLEHALHRVRRTPEPIGLIYLDLDRFKPVNDHLGHEIGDGVLEVVADRLRALVRGGDTVARVGGDEFAVLLEGVSGAEAVMASANRILAALRDEIRIEGIEDAICIGASVGVALSDGDIVGPSDLVRRADLAMYEAKKRGGFQAYQYHAELEEDHEFSERIEGDLRRAVASGALDLVYQPIIDVHGQRFMGLEALVRWTHPELGQVYPSQFIPIAEQSSLIADVDRWVLEHACRETRDLLAGDGGEEGLLLSVNLSARHFAEPDFIARISDIILETGIDPDRLQLELTETAAGGDAERVRRLKALGVKIAIDDFGSGYSSLGYLRDLDVDVLKVDRSFVLALGADPSSVAIVRTIITLADILELEVIIEGIEDGSQLGHLEELGGRYVQGFLWGRPVDRESLPDLLRGGVKQLEAEAARPEEDALGAVKKSRPYLPPLGGRPEGLTDLHRARAG